VPSLAQRAITLVIDPRLRSEANIKIDHLNTDDHQLVLEDAAAMASGTFARCYLGVPVEQHPFSS
jgi:hypothetical protein